jgi:hypothetical protein
MCSTVAGFLVAGGKAIFINSSAPSLWKWACGPERKKDVLKVAQRDFPLEQLPLLARVDHR